MLMVLESALEGSLQAEGGKAQSFWPLTSSCDQKARNIYEGRLSFCKIQRGIKRILSKAIENKLRGLQWW